MRLVKVSEVSWQGRTHFFAVCARMMRRILTDFARSRRYLKRGGCAAHLSFDEELCPGSEPHADIVALEDALNALSDVHRRTRQAGELRLRGGASGEARAHGLRVSV